MHKSPKNISRQDDSSLSTCLKLENFHYLKKKHPNNPFIEYLNINSLRNEIIDLR